MVDEDEDVLRLGLGFVFGSIFINYSKLWSTLLCSDCDQYCLVTDVICIQGPEKKSKAN